MERTRVRSLLVSALTATLEITAFAFCTALLAGRALLAARWAAGASGAVANFLLNRRWAFRRRDVRARGQAARYAVTALAAVTLATTVWWSLVTAAPVDPRLAHMASLVGVWLVFTYPVMARWVFVLPAQRAPATDAPAATDTPGCADGAPTPSHSDG